jgi:hypothetical protein
MPYIAKRFFIVAPPNKTCLKKAGTTNSQQVKIQLNYPGPGETFSQCRPIPSLVRESRPCESNTELSGLFSWQVKGFLRRSKGLHFYRS